MESLVIWMYFMVLDGHSIKHLKNCDKTELFVREEFSKGNDRTVLKGR